MIRQYASPEGATYQFEEGLQPEGYVELGAAAPAAKSRKPRDKSRSASDKGRAARGKSGGRSKAKPKDPA